MLHIRKSNGCTCEKSNTLEEAREKLIEVMKNGKATEKFKEFLSNQGGDGSIVDDPEKLPQAHM